ncbi:MAG: hypothetical protein Q9162_000782 [Coniocarpon cinnabarinum]
MSSAIASTTLVEKQQTSPLKQVFHQSAEDDTVSKTTSQPPSEAVAQLSARARRKKKRAMKPPPVAMNVVRGFETPPASGGEDSDKSSATSPRPDSSLGYSPSITSSPSVRPSGLSRALSELKLGGQVEEEPRGRRVFTPLRETCRQSSSSPLVHAISGDDDTISVQSELEVYDVPIESDFASAEAKPKKIFAGALEGGLRADSPHRKMTASDFTPLKCLGKGTYGTVLLVKQNSTGRLFAQKQLKKATLTVRKKLIEQTRSERQILESVNRHPFVVKLFYAFQDHAKLYLILEYAQGGELFTHLKMERMFSEEVAAFYMAEMILALDHLHRNLGVVYRDLKPENCLLDAEGHLLLTDFGLSKVAVTEKPDGSGSESSHCNSMQVGTVDYMAPEVIKGIPYDMAVDWWSLGALGYDLLTGAPPFASANIGNTQQKITNNSYKIQMPSYMGPDSKDLLIRLLRRDPKKRLGGNMPKDITIIKTHRFFRRIDWKALAKRELTAPIQPIVTDPELAENFDEEFTNLSMSPVDERKSPLGALIDGDHKMSVDDPFGGFSFVAPHSLLDEGGLLGC